MKLGYIDYLNCYPFYFHMFEREPLKGVQVFHRYPSDLNRMVMEGEIDMSPISAATCPMLNGKAMLIPDFCLSSVGYVGSVVLRSRLPIEALHKKNVGITSASHTSVLLLKMLMQCYYQVEPNYIKTSPNPSMNNMEAVLLIGNEAMVNHKKPVAFSYDLGELWLRKTGYPIVFAVFTVRDDAIGKYKKGIDSVIRSYRNSLICLKQEQDHLIEGARKKYPNIRYDIQDYYETLQFKFTHRLKEALGFYLDKAAELGLVNQKARLRYFDVTSQ